MKEENGTSGSPLHPETIKAIAKLTIKAQRIVEGLQGGAHTSPHLGASVEFAEHKKYNPGDDFRHLDWKVLARTDRYFVKQHQREVVLRGLMMLDCSASMNYRGTRAPSTKFEHAIELLAALSHILVRQGDAAGLMTFDFQTTQFIPPIHHPHHLQVIMANLVAAETQKQGQTDFKSAIENAAEYAGRRAMIIMASDLWGTTQETEYALSQLAARGHDIAIFHILDPDEVDLPYDRPAHFVSLEDEAPVDLDPSLIRAAYRNEIIAVRKRWQRFLGEVGISYVPALTDRSAITTLSEFLAGRHENRRRR